MRNRIILITGTVLYVLEKIPLLFDPGIMGEVDLSCSGWHRDCSRESRGPTMLAPPRRVRGSAARLVADYVSGIKVSQVGILCPDVWKSYFQHF